MSNAKKDGIPLPQNLYDELLDLGNELGVDIELPTI
jgi:phage-related holin